MGPKQKVVMSITQPDTYPNLRREGRRLGYGVAVAINFVMLIAVQNILEWGWLPFLTDEFVDVIPWISLSLVASVVVNLIYQFNDSALVKSTGQIGTNLTSIFATYQLFRVVPFDFSEYAFDWGIVTGFLLILAMVGSGIGMLAEAYKLVSYEPLTVRRNDVNGI